VKVKRMKRSEAIAYWEQSASECDRTIEGILARLRRPGARGPAWALADAAIGLPLIAVMRGIATAMLVFERRRPASDFDPE
jgi:hypothetical protein